METHYFINAVSETAFPFGLLHLNSPSWSVRSTADTCLLKLPLKNARGKRWSCILSFWPFHPELITTSNQKCSNYQYFQVRSQNPPLQPSRIWLAQSHLVCLCVCVSVCVCLCVCVAFSELILVLTHSPISSFVKRLGLFEELALQKWLLLLFIINKNQHRSGHWWVKLRTSLFFSFLFHFNKTLHIFTYKVIFCLTIWSLHMKHTF